MKLRDDLTLKEAWGWACGQGGAIQQALYDLSHGVMERGMRTYYYPKSFYEQPAIGSFGKFTNSCKWYQWGHLTKIEGTGFYNDGGEVFDDFTPGLPQDVTADGMPKETI